MPRHKFNSSENYNKGRIAISLQSSSDIKNFQSKPEENINLKSSITTKLPTKRSPSLILYNIPISTKEEEIQESLMAQLNLTSPLNLRFKFRGNSTETTNWVFEASASTLNTINQADLPSKSSKEIRESQLKDDHLRQIIESFESTHKDENFENWTGRGYLMPQGVLYCFAPDADAEEAQLVVPSHEITNVLKQYHDAPTAGHYGEEGTYHRIAKRYYWSGMRSPIAD
ncbi:hypothetical protein AVEN_39281-1 [Araneus ventricosus]|uniref:Integrase zinc-binding domain-containing protein n=1 Tax=Araneus ventricosus TaxID=182803 RepID=A0A4Y2Q065_ARAVE|nr:hypothetical protein AVEN_39281-1 [Araneus ventricosus]